ncbi:MAG: hypothetical protein GX813_03760 [Erysipelotrichia bacterium]|nr:hypothetical protein [Erysipelotrichia bacterium]
MYPDPLFTLFGLEVDLYTVFFIAGLISCILFTILAMKKSGYSSSASDTIILIGLIAIAVGLFSAILFQSFYDYLADPSAGFVLSGRMTFIGGLIGGILSFLAIYFLFVYLINPRLKKNNILKADMNKGLFQLLQFGPASITIAHAFGRVGCFFSGCCYGLPTAAWYGIRFQTTATKVIPTQLFEAIFLFIISAVMIVLYFRYKFKYNLTVYLIGYGVWRFLIEYLRDDDRGGFIPGLSPSQFWALVMIVAGIIFYFIYRYFLKKQKSVTMNDASL